MRNKTWKFLLIVPTLLLLTGCWDQRLLKDSRLVFASSFDLKENEKILTTAIIRDFIDEIPVNVMVQGEGNTIRETRINMDNKISGILEPSKNRMFLLGERLAQKDIYQFLDIFYRDPNSSVSAKIAVTEGNSADILAKMKEKNTLIGEYLIELVDSAEESTLIPKHNVQSICTFMFDEGKDFALPMFKLDKDNEVILTGTGLFHKQALVGSLTLEESTLFLILSNQKGKVARFVSKIDGDREMRIKNYITYNFSKVDSDLSIISDDPENIEVEIKSKIGVTIVEYPEDELANEKKIKKLNESITKDLNIKAEKMIKNLQESNSDLFGIGRDLIAFHPETWKKVDWEEKYSTITITPKIETEIIGHGIIN
ncbi:Ger(x)C family spore germination protein [Bacillus sp. CH30_1T]|uniref:Ger(x)C family spore germination protein n=1 Tax=Bacillus sp. CH30_1T TaxID=2604836 RepID=UPI0011ECCD26|nr:Ger(x)C family spore germination protein [Bacillus sp. CH30_1T]KAA0563516.1 Ger(x)C family spore germination protein [Bacillus sp. CH30_1T]